LFNLIVLKLGIKIEPIDVPQDFQPFLINLSSQID